MTHTPHALTAAIERQRVHGEQLTARGEERKRQAAAMLQEAEELQRQAGMATAELRGLERALKLLKGQSVTRDKGRDHDDASGDASRYGRQVGAISDRWRKILRAMVRGGNGFCSHRQIIAIVGDLGYNLAASSIRDRVRRYHGAGIFERRDHTYRVAASAVQQYGLDEEGPDDESGPSNAMGAAG